MSEHKTGVEARSFPPVVSEAAIAVIGAGTMGAGIAEVAARAGHEVRLIDLNPSVLQSSRTTIVRSLDGLVDKGRLSAGARDATLGRIEFHSDLHAAAGCGLAIEAIVERMEAKRGLLAGLEAVLPAGAVIATNTSSLSVGEMAAGMKQPQRFLGLHFFNPVPAMKLVEIVPGPATTQGLTEIVVALMEMWGKTPVIVRDVPGFIVNRLARPVYAEAFEAWAEGVEPQVIDTLLTGSGGFRMGPLALADLIGHDINYAAAVSVYEGYQGRTRFRPQPSQKALIDAGRLGRKSGAGVYVYSGVSTPAPAYVPPGTEGALIAISADPGELGGLVSRLEASGVLEVDGTLAPGLVRIGDVLVAAGDGRPLSARTDGVAVILDAARDFGVAETIGLAAVSDDAASRVATALDRVGVHVLRLPDRPGLLVLRTLVQLAASSLDALADEIASVEDISAAMRLGANHPESPLDWAGRFGLARLRQVQTHLAEATGNPLYAPDRRPSSET